MLLLRKLKISVTAVALSVVFTAEAAAGLAGFHLYNPYTVEERILDLDTAPEKIHNYRADMRSNLLMLIRYAKKQNPDFKIIIHGGQELLTKSLWEYGRESYNHIRAEEKASDDSFLFHKNYKEREPERYTDEYEYLNSVDAVAINNLFCGKGKEGEIVKNHNLGMITIEQCEDKNGLDGALINAMMQKKITYAFSNLDDAFNNIGDHNSLNDSAKNVFKITDAQNILILNDDSRYQDKNELAADLLGTNYDIIVIKPLFANKERFDAEDLRKLHFKKNGTKRLLIAELNVSEASPQDYFWLRDWKIGNPDWLVRKSFSSKDGFIVRYWDNEWKQIVSRYFKDIVNEGFDGVFFTGIENYEYFEKLNPLE